MIIDLRALKAAGIAMSDEKTRYYLNGVCLEMSAAGALAIATDGHRLVAMAATEWDATKAESDVRSIIIPAPVIKRIKLTKRVSECVLSDRGDEWRIDYHNEAFTFKPIEGATFPEWRRVLPTHRAIGAWAHFDPAYVADFGKIAAVYDGQSTIIPNGESAAWVRFDDDVPGIGVLMPKRNVLAGIAPPAWCSWTAPVAQDMAA